MNKTIISLAAWALLLAGCASGVVRSGADNGPVRLSADRQVAAVSLTLTPEARKKAGENLKFDPAQLLSHIRRALEAKDLVSADTGRPRPNLEIQVKDMRVRSNFSAVMWGFMAGSDSIAGDIVLSDPAGEPLDRFEVSVSYALGGLAGGQDDARMGWLYEKFAEETVKELTKP